MKVISMFQRIAGTTLGLLLVTTAWGAHQAQAAQPYRGVYVVLDPYSVGDLQKLQKAASTHCPTTETSAPSSTFCGAADGILLRIGWCDFEPDHTAANTAASSCHYILGYSNGAGSAAKQMSPSQTAEHLTPCPQTYDTCATAAKSTLATALGYIAQINANRAASYYLPPLKLSLGLSAGIWTPQSVLNSVGFVDVPHDMGSSGNPASEQCYRLPLVWQPTYVAKYETAVDRLLSFTLSQFPKGANITMVKASGIAATDLEVEMPGNATAVASPAGDPGTSSSGHGPLMNCSSTIPSANIWLNAYNAAPVASRSFTQAVEYSFGAMIGHEYATLQNKGLNALISVPTTGGRAFTDVTCGISGSQTCSVQKNSGNWSLYYLSEYVDDLFHGGVAQTAAASAFTAARPNASFTMTPAQLAVNWTALKPTPITAGSQIGCALNNTIAADQPTLKLNGLTQKIPGVGSVIGWQTQTQSGGECSTTSHNSYMTALNNGISQGGQFIEVEGDAAFTDINSCGADLHSASAQLLASALTSCHY
jgi:hypothetical protein